MTIYINICLYTCMIEPVFSQRSNQSDVLPGYLSGSTFGPTLKTLGFDGVPKFNVYDLFNIHSI